MSIIRIAEPMIAASTISKDFESKLARCYLTLRIIPHLRRNAHPPFLEVINRVVPLQESVTEDPELPGVHDLQHAGIIALR